MEIRSANIIIGRSGGTAKEGSKTYKAALPSKWMAKMGINSENRQVDLLFDGDKIIISAKEIFEEYIKKRKVKDHKLILFKYFDGDLLCSEICADYTEKTLKCRNYTDDFVKNAFGNNTAPNWQDLTEFLKERCVPESRSGIREYLEQLGLNEYDPLRIIGITEGRMAEDNQYLKIEMI